MTERDLFIAALQLEPSERPGLFERECHDDPALRAWSFCLLHAQAGQRLRYGRRHNCLRDFDRRSRRKFRHGARQPL